MKTSGFRLFAFVAVLACASPAASAKPPLDAFGDMPDVRSMEISPDGRKIAFLARAGDREQVMLYDIATKKQEMLAATGDFKSGSVAFANNDYVILTASKTTRNLEWMTDKFEDSSAFAINVKTRKSVQLLTKTPLLWPAQSGLHTIAGYDTNGTHVFMPAYTTDGRLSGDAPRDLLRVSMETGVGLATGGRKGVHGTRDWIVNAKGEVVAREDWIEKTGEYSIRVYDGDKQRELLKRTEKRPTLGVLGLTPDGKSLVVSDKKEASEFYSLYLMSIADGAITGPILKRADADIAGLMMSNGRVIDGVRYAGMFPTYEMFDAAVEADIKGIQAKLPDSAVMVDSWSDNWDRVLLHISAGGLTERYALFDRKARTMDLIGVTRPLIKDADVGQVNTIEYKASDGLTIPALVTWPAGVAEKDRKNLPLVVLPHGGPESYDSVGFDWLAQFFANEGYMVFQPNFRGSGGFGESFATAGHNQWGRKMQSDITEGVEALVKMGWADGKRACILGASYGGYAALAGGAMTPDKYKCVVAIAGVSDLIEMLGQERRDHGGESSPYRYWTMHIGNPDTDKDAIEAVSPVNMADRFRAPVLLIHGTDDLVVPTRQSDKMEAALKRAGKPVTYMKLKGDDHGLSISSNRKAALQAIGDFLKKHIGTAPAAQ